MGKVSTSAENFSAEVEKSHPVTLSRAKNKGLKWDLHEGPFFLLTRDPPDAMILIQTKWSNLDFCDEKGIKKKYSEYENVLWDSGLTWHIPIIFQFDEPRPLPRTCLLIYAVSSMAGSWLLEQPRSSQLMWHPRVRQLWMALPKVGCVEK